MYVYLLYCYDFVQAYQRTTYITTQHTLHNVNIDYIIVQKSWEHNLPFGFSIVETNKKEVNQITQPLVQMYKLVIQDKQQQ